jgi:hypothetical protein
MNMIKRFFLIAGVTALLVVPSGAQSSQASNEMTIPEFRQVLVDLGTYLDAHKGTNLASQFSAIPDEQLNKLYPAVSNPRQLQSAITTLKEHDAALASGSLVSPRTRSAPRASITPDAGVGTCGPNSIIDDSSGSACTPAYPDPNNTAWQNLVNPLITFGAFSPSDYASVSSQSCGLTVESNLSQVSSALQGAVLAASSICSALPPIASNICWAANAVFSVADAVSFGLFADCTEQDGNVNAAQIDAAFHNTVTIFNALNAGFANASTQLTNVNSQITGEFTTVNTNLSTDFNALSTQVANVDIHLTNVDNHIATEFANLTTVVNQATAQLNAELKQVMKLEMTPDGQKKLNPAILTCTGTNCPNVLANCPAAGCSWNNVGPLP